MPWLQVKLDIAPDQSESYEEILMAAGSAAVTYEDGADQPIFEPDLGTTPLWNKTRITGLFSADHNIKALQSYITEAHQLVFQQDDAPQIHAEILEDKDWEREWMSNYHPMQFGERLWICPSWREAPDPDAVNLLLDPGLAFGTGTHPTTALCLEWLDQQNLVDKDVTDYGCGSGILGIAALLLGAKQTVAVDIDPQALTATNDNLARNNLAPAKLDTYLPEHTPAHQSDVLVANILAGPLVELAPTIAQHVKSGGLLALSGLLKAQADEIVTTYSEWFDLDPIVYKEDWIRVTGTKK